MLQSREPTTVLISRHMRRFFARLLIGLFVYSQLALAAHACTTASPDAENSSGLAMAVGEMPPDREWTISSTVSAWQWDLAQPELCVGHCQSAQQNIDVKPAASPALVLMAGYFTLEPRAQRAEFGQAAIGPADGPPPQADPPHAILHCCFRI